MEVRNTFKGLDLIEYLMNYGQRFVILYRRQGSRPSPWKRNEKRKWLSEEALQIAVKIREAKSKGEKERYTHLNAEFQRMARRDKKAFLSDKCREIKEKIEWELLEISSGKLEIPREYFMQRLARLRTEIVWTSQKQKILRGDMNTQKNCPKRSS